jgi:hypothetical protein
VINDDDSVIAKFSQCNNCGLIHKVVDICRSEVITNKESMSSIVSVEDIKTSLPKSLVDILERNSADLNTWEHAQFIIANKLWGEFVVIAHEEDSGTQHGKYVVIMSETFFKIETFSREDVLKPQE